MKEEIGEGESTFIELVVWCFMLYIAAASGSDNSCRSCSLMKPAWAAASLVPNYTHTPHQPQAGGQRGSGS